MPLSFTPYHHQCLCLCLCLRQRPIRYQPSYSITNACISVDRAPSIASSSFRFSCSNSRKGPQNRRMLAHVLTHTSVVLVLIPTYLHNVQLLVYRRAIRTFSFLFSEVVEVVGGERGLSKLIRSLFQILKDRCRVYPHIKIIIITHSSSPSIVIRRTRIRENIVFYVLVFLLSIRAANCDWTEYRVSQIAVILCQLGKTILVKGLPQRPKLFVAPS